MVIMNNANTTERLIQEVRSRPPLWDQRNLNYHNRVVVNTLWQDIADLLQVNKETVKVKWKGLRDTYRRELKKQRSSAIIQNGGENARDPSWTHYSSMNFLREYMGSSSNNNNNNNNNNHNQGDLFHFQGWPTDDMLVDDEAGSPAASNEAAFTPYAAEATHCGDSVKPPSIASPVPSLSGDDSTRDVKIESRSPAEQPEMVDTAATTAAAESLSSLSPPPHYPDHRARPADDEPTRKRPISRLPRFKEKKLRLRMQKGKQLLQQQQPPPRSALSHQRNGLSSPVDDSDDDLYFFKSLIPYVKGLPPARKLYLRSEIHNLVLREIMADSQSNGSSSHSHTHSHHQHHTVIPLEHVTVGLNA